AEGLVRFRHLDRLLTLGHGLALAAEGGHELVGQAVEHGLALLAAGGADDPAERKTLLALRTHGHRHLIGSAADSTGADFQRRLDVFDSLLEDLKWVRLGAHLVLDLIEGAIEDALGGALLAVPHQAVDEL